MNILLLLENEPEKGEFYPFDDFAAVEIPIPVEAIFSSRAEVQKRIQIKVHGPAEIICKTAVEFVSQNDLLEYDRIPTDKLPEITFEVDEVVLWSSKTGFSDIIPSTEPFCGKIPVTPPVEWLDLLDSAEKLV